MGRWLLCNIFANYLPCLLIYLPWKLRNTKAMVEFGRETCSSEAASRRVLCKKVFLKIWQNSEENTFVRVSFSIKLQAKTYKFIKKETWHRFFPMNFATFLRTPVLQTPLSDCIWLLLECHSLKITRRHFILISSKTVWRKIMFVSYLL